ncbi:hypothetical protein [Nitrosomonas communis]|uniref:hypothetical protein n=1 Tax=Nitrosomonas communis TaxID=44574 RepID=UPI000944261C|nr:hypothetical protein [Nitrosomonas communis]
MTKYEFLEVPFNKKTIFVIILIGYTPSGHVSANSTNVSASGANSPNVIAIEGGIQQDNLQSNRQGQTHKQTKLQKQMKSKKNRKFQRTLYPMFP